MRISSILAGWRFAASERVSLQAIKWGGRIAAPAGSWPGDGREQTLIPKPLFEQDRPLVQRCETRSQSAAVIAITEDMHFCRDPGRNEGIVEIDAGADGNRLIVCWCCR